MPIVNRLPIFASLFLGLAMVLTLSGAPAAPAQAAAPTDDASRQIIRQVENYFADLGTAKARFLQTAPNGNQLLGTFYLNRPGRMRFEYDDIQDFIVADGLFVYFYDSELGEQSNAPIGQTLADFLLRPNLKLSGDIMVTDVTHSTGLIRVTVTQTSDPGAGSLVLAFGESPFALKKWRVLDATGAVTEVELFDLQKNVKLDSRLFAYHRPASSKPRYNQ